MVNGFFLGGVQEGISERRLSDREDRKQSFTEDTTKKQIALEEKRVGLQAAGVSQAERRLSLDEKKELNDEAYRDKTLSLQERTLKIQADAQKFREDQDVAARADKIITDLMGTVKETVTALRSTGRTTEEAAAAVKPLVSKIASLASKTNLDGDLYLNQVQSMLAGPTAGEIAAVKGSVQATEKLAEASTLAGAGVKSRAAFETAGVKVAPKEIDLRTFTLPSGERKSVRADDSEGIDAAIAAGGVSTPLSVQAADLSGVGVNVPSKKDVEAAHQGIISTQTNINELEIAIKEFKKNPEALGVTGHVIENVGGLVDQLPWGVGDAALKGVGIDLKQVSKTRTQARALVGQVLRLVSQDNSRFSEGDRKLAEDTIRTMTPTASDTVVKAAAEQVVDIMKRQQLKDIDQIRVAAKISVKDLDTVDGINKLGDILMNKGMSDDQAEEAIHSIRKRFHLE